MLAISKAGHDKGKWYYILKDEGEFVYLSDGRLRPIEKPKRKNKKHISMVKDNTAPNNNEEIKRLIKERFKDNSREDMNV